MGPIDYTARFDAIDRRIGAIQGGLDLASYRGRNFERYTVEKMQKQVFINCILISLVFSFSVLCCIFEPTLTHFSLTLGLCGCLYTGMLVCQFSNIIFNSE